MATTSLMSTQLRLVLETGVDENGKSIFRSKNFNNMKPSATPDALFAVALALAPLQQHSLFAVERNDSSDLQA
ncbi:DUF1659 domain-containing protein [Guptibacillus hwajinpoensis]|uniref:DUF1659 domain-containing protein n=1 Tax=Guptibacillus hwajinpoensis TaxID=208199 RepID=A0ABU0K206_9BACL|nr:MULTISPECIES: DUF1659 domain-containing protein [Alkalihalobacillus]MDP4552616.1 DUF1659 domain-containing protein [Alkalihalobacillus macyae]MDQ0482516.1 hypothetical protein [Alkalihalobacillus hemicentroti]